MKQRGFPNSFWRNYSPPESGATSSTSATSSLSSLAMHANHAALTAAAAVNAGHADIYGHDPYFLAYGTAGAAAGGSTPSGADSWHNYMSPYSHRSGSMQDVYSVSRLNHQQYSSFLQLQSMRQAAAQGGRSAIDGYSAAAATSHPHYMTGKSLLLVVFGT